MTAVMNDQRELVEVFIVSDETIGTLERIVMRIAIHFERGLHGLAAQTFRIGVLRARHYYAASLAIHEFT